MINKIVLDTSLDKTEKLILIYFFVNTDYDKSKTVSLREISRELQITKQTIIIKIKNLVDKGYIEKKIGFDKNTPLTNTYKLNLAMYEI